MVNNEDSPLTKHFLLREFTEIINFEWIDRVNYTEMITSKTYAFSLENKRFFSQLLHASFPLTTAAYGRLRA